MNLKTIYSKIKSDENGNIIGSVIVGIRVSKKSPEIVEVKMVFVKDRHSKNWLALMSTDVELCNE